MTWTIREGDALSVLRTMADESAHCCVTSPPYFAQRDYGVEGQIGQEATPAEYVAKLVAVFAEVRRVLRADGTCWINLGDTFANDDKWGGSTGGKHAPALHGRTSIGRGRRVTGLKPKELIGIPWMVAFALREEGWWLRSDIVWSKPSPMPESVKDRPSRAHEFIFLLTKSAHYVYDADAVREPHADRRENKTGASARRGQAAMKPTGTNDSADRWYSAGGRNARSVWTIANAGAGGENHATYPEEIPRRCIRAGCPRDGVVLDPFCGEGTTLVVALAEGRSAVGIELNPRDVLAARRRIEGDAPLFNVPAGAR